jgi:hypothetical protein
MMNEMNIADENRLTNGDCSFIDIKIDSDNDDEQETNKSKNTSNKLTDKFFNFNKHKSKQQQNNTSKLVEQSKLAAETVATSSSSSCCSTTTHSSCSSPPTTATISVKSPLPHQSLSSNSNSTKTLTLNEAADMLLSNLNEINLNSYDDEDDLEDDDDELDTNITSTTINNEKKTSFYDLKLNNDLKYDDFLKPKELFNSTLISSLQSISSYANNQSDLDGDNSKMLDDLALTDISLNDNIPILQNTNEPKIINENNNLILLDENNNSLVKTSKDKLSNSSGFKLPAFRANSIPLQQMPNSISKPSLKLIKNLSHPVNGCRSDSLVEGLLGDIYDRFNVTLKESMDSDVFTELSSSRFSGCDSTADHDMETRYYSKFHKLARPTLQTFSTIIFKHFI